MKIIILNKLLLKIFTKKILDNIIQHIIYESI